MRRGIGPACHSECSIENGGDEKRRLASLGENGGSVCDGFSSVRARTLFPTGTTLELGPKDRRVFPWSRRLPVTDEVREGREDVELTIISPRLRWK